MARVGSLLLWLASALALAGAVPAGGAPAVAADPIVADWNATQTCRHGGCSNVYGTVRVTDAGGGSFAAVVTSKLWLLGDAACTHAPGQQVWQLRLASPGTYSGTSDVFTSDSSAGFNCQHSAFPATWTLTGKNKLTLSSTAYGGITHVFARSPLVDETPPTVVAGAARGTHGKIMRFVFAVRDDSGRATVTITIRKGSRTWTIGTPGPVSAKGEQQSKGWAVPAGLRGGMSYCVSATDEAGNRSAEVCRPLTIR